MTGATFGNKHTDELGLRWLAPFVMPQPKLVTKRIQVPGRDGTLDYSQAITGYPTYEDRVFTLHFEVENKTEAGYMTKISELTNLLHGQKMKVKLDTDPDFEWDCTLEVGNTRPNTIYGTVDIVCTAYPYKRKLLDTVVQATLENSTTELICNNLAEPVVPVFELSASMNIAFKGKSGGFSAGTHILDIVFEAGQNVVTVSGTGTVKITYREGSL